MRKFLYPITMGLLLTTATGFAQEKEPLKEFNVGMVNVLELGVKNDGSQGVSDIVNRYTEKYSLYFPSGIYKVDKPIFLRNPIKGDGYSRHPAVKMNRTWLVSAIENKDASVGVINFLTSNQINIIDLNIKCNSHECGIRVDNYAATFIDGVGIYNMRSYGMFIRARGSRLIFAQNMTIFGARDHAVPCVGIYNGPGSSDNRFVNIEMMGIRVGMEVYAGYTYGSNLHIWTGCLAQKDNGTWWRGTRGIVLGNGAHFEGSNIYPDTSFYALEQTGPHCAFVIQNIMYWEDNSTGGSPDFDGKFFHCPPGTNGTLVIDGGEIGVKGDKPNIGRMQKLYMPDAKINNVFLRCDFPIKAEHIDKLCLSNSLPSYTVLYDDQGFCKVADIFTVAETGACEGILTLDDGAAFKIALAKDKSGTVEKTNTPLNKLCQGHELKFIEEPGLVKIYVKSPQKAPLRARFDTTYMGNYFRPLDYSLLRTRGGSERYREVLPLQN